MTAFGMAQWNQPYPDMEGMDLSGMKVGKNMMMMAMMGNKH